jgi:hypothetical protein
MTSEISSFRLPLDHVVIAVSDLKKSVELFRCDGFQVVYGGKNGPTHNALIFFKDGKYIELISLRSIFFKTVLHMLLLSNVLNFKTSKSVKIDSRFRDWFKGEFGLCDWCLRCEDIYDSVAALREQGFITTNVEKYNRVRPDGVTAKWMLAGTKSRSLPFLIQDISPVAIRVPFAGNCAHDNGVTGIANLTLNRDHLPITDEQLHLFCNTFDIESSLTTNVRVESRPGNPSLLLELKSNGDNKGRLMNAAKCNAHINIT